MEVSHGYISTEDDDVEECVECGVQRTVLEWKWTGRPIYGYRQWEYPTWLLISEPNCIGII